MPLGQARHLLDERLTGTPLPVTEVPADPQPDYDPAKTQRPFIQAAFIRTVRASRLLPTVRAPARASGVDTVSTTRTPEESLTHSTRTSIPGNIRGTGGPRSAMIGVNAGNGDRMALGVLTQYQMATTEQMHQVITPQLRIEQTQRRLARLREEGPVEGISLPQAGQTRVWFPTAYGVQPTEIPEPGPLSRPGVAPDSRAAHRPRRQEEQGSTAESAGPVHDSPTLRCVR